MYSTTSRYRQLYASGELAKRAEALQDSLSCCTLCPWRCKVNRISGERGRCKAPAVLKVAKALAHFGEEPALSGTRGSGTIFFSHCHLSCCFCQNYQISQEGRGETVSSEELAQKMLSLQEQECHNINLVSPTQYLPHIVQALCFAVDNGLTIPLVYNSNGYESVETLRMLAGVVDIYLPDAKYGEDRPAQIYSQAKAYTKTNQAALREMYAQVGPLILNSEGIAVQGLIIRHLVLPGNLSQTETVLKRIKSHLGTQVHISLMCQYLPVFKAHQHNDLNRRTSPEEYDRAIADLTNLGFENGWLQEYEAIDGEFLPDFQKGDAWH
jgi:putative pyruvate formate lyase activating enzyme